MEKRRWEGRAAMLICVAFFAVVAVLGIRYLLPVLLPFLVSWGLSQLIRPASRTISRHTGIPQKGCAVVLFAGLLGCVLLVIYLSTSRLLRELEHFLQNVLERDKATSLLSPENDLFSIVAEALPFLNRFSGIREQFNDTLSKMLSEALSALSLQIPNFVAALLGAIPDFFLLLLVTVISGFYFCTSDTGVPSTLVRYLPPRIRDRLPHWRARIKQFSWRFLRAYLLLLLLTFGLLLLGFLVLGVKYAFLLAMLVAVVDMLPVLGVGTVLIPWSIFALLGRQYLLGVGLLVLYAVVLIVRQVLEPKLLGGSLGLHPVAALFATFAGWRLFGFWGMILGPVAAVLVKMLLENVAKSHSS